MSNAPFSEEAALSPFLNWNHVAVIRVLIRRASSSWWWWCRRRRRGGGGGVVVAVRTERVYSVPHVEKAGS